MLWNVGVVANTAATGSIHTDTFLRAVALAIEQLAPRCAGQLAFHLVNDGASAEGARCAAEHLLRANVHAVIGHYASAAASAAAPLYAAAGVPLLLPAATADALIESHPNTVRVCGSDRQLAGCIHADLNDNWDIGAVVLQHDAGVHGRALAACVRRHLDSAGGVVATDDIARADAAIFSGSFANSVEFVHSVRATHPRLPIFLTDDAVHAALVAALPAAANVYVYGFGAAASPPNRDVCRTYRARWGADPGVYFLETYAALQVACELGAMGVAPPAWIETICARSWPTVLGPINFIGRERVDPPYVLWSVDGDALAPLRPLSPARTLLPA